MAYKLDSTVGKLVTQLVGKLTDYSENTQLFDYIRDHFLTSLRQSDSTYCATQKEINVKVSSLADKFRFHGHIEAADIFLKLYKEFLGSSPLGDELQNKLQVLHFLLCLSVSPTNYLQSLPHGFQSEFLTKSEEIIDWKSYLLEGIEWNPVFSDSDDSDWDDDIDSTRSLPSAPKLDDHEENVIVQGCSGYDEARTQLRKDVQHSWWNDPFYRDKPQSNNPQANIAFAWEEYLSEVSHGLLGGPINRILSEYKVIREILWQQYNPHNSVVFTWTGEELLVNDDVTISSLRPFVFKNLIETFIPNIMMIHKLRSFHHRVINDENSPKTYWGYAEAVMGFVRTALEKIATFELEVLRQESTITIIKTANHLNEIYKDVKYIHMLHSFMILDYTKYPPHACCIVLLTKLYNELFNVFEKQQMDIVITLYMESVYKYVRIIQDWFRTDELNDTQNEFPVELKLVDYGLPTVAPLKKKDIFDRAKYVPRDISLDINIKVDSDPLMSLIYKEVVQFGSNIHLFNLLGKLNLLHGTDFCIYDAWLKAVLEHLVEYFPPESTQCDEPTEQLPDIPALFWKPSLRGSDNESEHNMATCNHFLAMAFSSVHGTIGLRNRSRKREKSTFEKISSISRNTFPGVQFYISDSLRKILKSKYQDCGSILKTLFKQEYQIAEHLEVLCKVFLFKDDIIFPFYRKQFLKIESNANWGNDIWLTYELQDILRDVHPHVYENILVSVKPGWQHLLEDPLKTCTLLDVKYKISWPIDVIVTARHEKMYKEMFYFILKLKWALYTLNHLQYTRIEQKRRQKAPKYVKVLFQKLEVLRFGFINVFAALQHYVLGYVWRIFDMKFRADFENAMDLHTLIDSHHEFIYGFHRAVARVRDYKEKSYGVDWALYSVRQLRTMWIARGEVKDQVLKKVEDGLKECHKNIFEVIIEQHLYD